MAGKLIRAANPPFLTLVNGGVKRKRRTHRRNGGHMAVRRRRRRRAVARAAPRRNYHRRRRVYRANPIRRRRRRNYTHRVHHRRRRRSNPFPFMRHHRRRYSRRRRNPGIRGPLTQAMWIAGGGVATEFVMGYVPAGIANFLPAPYGALATKAAVAYAVGWGAHKFLGVSPAHSELLMGGGLSSVVLDAFQLLVQGKLPTLFQPKGAVQAAAAAPAAPGMGAVVGIGGAKYHPYFGWGTGMGSPFGAVVGYRDRN